MTPRNALIYVAGGFAAVSAVLHLVLGLDGTYGSIVEGTIAVMPLLFIVSAVVVVALLAALVRGDVPPPTVYAVGVVIMFLNLVAYADWHAFGVVEGALGLEDGGASHDHDTGNGNGNESHGHDDGHDDHSHDDHGGDDHSHDDGSHDDEHSHDDGHDHDGSALETLVDHLRGDLDALVTKVSETISMLAFAALYVLER